MEKTKLPVAPIRVRGDWRSRDFQAANDHGLRVVATE